MPGHLGQSVGLLRMNGVETSGCGAPIVQAQLSIMQVCSALEQESRSQQHEEHDMHVCWCGFLMPSVEDLFCQKWTWPHGVMSTGCSASSLKTHIL